MYPFEGRGAAICLAVGGRSLVFLALTRTFLRTSWPRGADPLLTSLH